MDRDANCRKVDKDDPARFLAYNSYVNINNLFYQIWRAITNAHIVESASSTYLIQVSTQCTINAMNHLTLEDVLHSNTPRCPMEINHRRRISLHLSDGRYIELYQ